MLGAFWISNYAISSCGQRRLDQIAWIHRLCLRWAFMLEGTFSHIEAPPSKHTTLQQCCYNVAATSRRYSDVVTTLLGRCVFAGLSFWKHVVSIRKTRLCQREVKFKINIQSLETVEGEHESTFLLTFASNEDSNQPAHPSDQSLRCPMVKTLHPWLSKMCPVKILIGLCKCAGRSESSAVAHVRMYVFWYCGSMQCSLFSRERHRDGH